MQVYASTVLYVAPVWGESMKIKTYLEKLNISQREFLLSVARAQRTTSKVALHVVDAGVYSCLLIPACMSNLVRALSAAKHRNAVIIKLPVSSMYAIAEQIAHYLTGIKNGFFFFLLFFHMYLHWDTEIACQMGVSTVKNTYYGKLLHNYYRNCKTISNGLQCKGNTFNTYLHIIYSCAFITYVIIGKYTNSEIRTCSYIFFFTTKLSNCKNLLV